MIRITQRAFNDLKNPPEQAENPYLSCLIMVGCLVIGFLAVSLLVGLVEGGL
ncbi:hypothetical protein [Prochlorococcus sp. ALOHA_ZT_50]|jgi:hypothetical protein|uniref:hypothetical protein n=1 Tax=Prochlorococcus sp. ALOHA_ZT_50 TaxID=2919303 RepID=UPI00257DAB08|nr:hypothetical protein [Prochlorococcus sp. ALOHA_ZT_50]MCH2079600.1 hypothetical protein [Prochlorococcus sp. ALOHA_ZT_50]